jgi:rubrerythrin
MTACPSLKTPYATASAAMSAAQAIRARRKRGGAKKQQRGSTGVEVYRCRECAHFHLGREQESLTRGGRK